MILEVLGSLQSMKCVRFLHFLHSPFTNSHYNKKKKERNHKKNPKTNYAVTTLNDTLAADVKISNNLYRYFERHKVNFVVYRDTLSGKKLYL